MLKVVNGCSKGKDPKTFTLRDIRSEALTSWRAAVTYLIKAQLSHDITEEDFDIGYLLGNIVVSIGSKADLDELWEGLRSQQTPPWNKWWSTDGWKRSAQDYDEAGIRRKKDDESKEAKVEEMIQTLQGKHG